MKNKILMTILLALGLGLTACNNNKKDDGGQAPVAAAPGTRSTPDPGLLSGSPTCGTGNVSIQNGQALKDFLEGFYDSNLLGNVDLSSGVVIWARTFIRRSDGLAVPDFNGAKSFIEISINDSLVNNGQVKTKIKFRVPLSVDNGGQSSAINNRATIYYKDEFSTITLDAPNYNVDQAQGTISFLNNKTQKSGTLGTFSIRTCALFVEPK